jgi:hypothetical protein
MGLVDQYHLSKYSYIKSKNLTCLPYLIKLVGLVITVYTARSNTKEFYILPAKLVTEKAVIASATVLL